MTTDPELVGRVAIVTGAAGGLGAGIAHSLAERGAALALADIDGEGVERACRRLVGLGAAAVAIVADVSEAPDVERLVAEARASLGPIDVLVNNAGILRTTPFVDIDEDEWDQVIGANLKSVYLCSRAVLRDMIRRSTGAIVNIASIAAFHRTTDHVHYGVSKAGVVALTRDLAYEVAPHGVRVNAVAPGPIATPMSQEAAPAELREALTSSLRLGRWGEPRDVGEAVAFLASARASFVTGTTLTVAGGADLAIISRR